MAVYGTKNDDTLNGQDDPGNGYYDSLYGSGGDDELYGGLGNDRLDGGAGQDDLYGGSGADLLYGGSGNDALYGGAGHDLAVYYGAHSRVTVDLALTGAQNTGGGGSDTLVGVEGVSGTDFNDLLLGSDDGNTLRGLSGDDTLRGRGGDDRLAGGLGDDRLDGGEGYDEADYFGGEDIDGDEPPGVTVDLRIEGPQYVEGYGFDTLISIEAVSGHYALDDLLIGDSGANRLSGRGGDDTLQGGGGDDVLQGGLFLPPRDTSPEHTDVDQLFGGGGDDILLDNGGDKLDGGSGWDTASYEGAYGAVTVDLGETRLVSVESLIGSRHSDTLRGDEGSNRLSGGRGDDFLQGGAGVDVLLGGLGRDRLDGGSGIDTASYREAAASVSVNRLTSAHGGQAYGDQLISIERFLMSDQGDRFQGSAEAETAYGYAGDDWLSGGGGNDWLHGGDGRDELTGGVGGDRFVFSYASQTSADAAFADRITDLSRADVIDLSDIDANVAVQGDQDFVRVQGDGEFTAAGQMRLTSHGGDTWLELNTDSDDAAEAIILLTGDHRSATAEDGWAL